MLSRRVPRLLLTTALLASPATAVAGVSITPAGEPYCDGATSGTVTITYENVLTEPATLRAITVEPGTCAGYRVEELMLGLVLQPNMPVSDSFTIDGPTATACDVTFWIEQPPPAAAPGPIDAAALTSYDVHIDGSSCIAGAGDLTVATSGELSCDGGVGIGNLALDNFGVGPLAVHLAPADASCDGFGLWLDTNAPQPELDVTIAEDNTVYVNYSFDPLEPGGVGQACAYVATTSTGVAYPFVLTRAPGCAAIDGISSEATVDLGNLALGTPGELRLRSTATDTVEVHLRWATADAWSFDAGAADLDVTVPTPAGAAVPAFVAVGGPHADVITLDNSDLTIAVTGFGFGPVSGTLAPSTWAPPSSAAPTRAPASSWCPPSRSPTSSCATTRPARSPSMAPAPASPPAPGAPRAR